MPEQQNLDQRLRDAFEAVHEGYSADRVIADPVLNESFIEECRTRGFSDDAAHLNRRLMNLRKRSGLTGIRTTKPTSFRNDDEYRFASEMSIRFLERRDQITLDDILCDPVRAEEFDSICDRIAPGFTPLEYRWAALTLRKSRRLQPEQLAHVRPSERVEIRPVHEIEPADLPRQAGLYVFFTTDTALYAGETANLRTRMKKHLDHSDNKGLARWMWEHEGEPVYLELHYLAGDPATKVRRALERELIQSRRPLFNTLGR